MAFYNKKQAVYSTIRVVKGKSSRAAIKTACEAISYQMRYAEKRRDGKGHKKNSSPFLVPNKRQSGWEQNCQAASSGYFAIP